MTFSGLDRLKPFGDILQHFFTILAHLLGLLPPSWRFSLAGILAWIWFDLLRIRRKQVITQLLATGVASTPSEAVKLGRLSVRHTCLVFLDTLTLDERSAQEIRESIDPGRRHLVDDALKRGRGAIVITAHLGYFDRLAMSQSAEGYPIVMVTKRLKPASLHRFWMASRRRFGLEILEAGDNFEALAEALKGNKVLGLVIDQHAPHGLRTTFLGLPCRSLAGVARLALVTGAPILPLSLPGDGTRFRMEFGEPLGPPRNAEEIPRITQQCQDEIQKLVRKTPEQWLWLHRRWKG